jgi:hypothetical protein
LNAWRAESFRTAQEYLTAANEQAARTILRVVAAGDVRASLAVLRGVGALTPQKVGPAFAPQVKRELEAESEVAKAASGILSRKKREKKARKALEDNREAVMRDAHWERFTRDFLRIPPLPRPIDHAAVVHAASRTKGLYATRISYTIIAAAPPAEGDPGMLVDQLCEDCGKTAEQVEAKLKKLPWLLNYIRKWNEAEGHAKLLESMGAKVELRPSWVE